MNDLEARLARCFAAAFPGIDPSVITSASLETEEAWDSVAAVTLVTLIEEEFGVQMDLEALEHLSSFSSILNYLSGLPSFR
jgi:acyl carrier protein